MIGKMALSMQPRIYQDHGKNDPTARQSGQGVYIPFLMPGISPGQHEKEYCQYQSDCPGNKQKDPGNVRARLVQLPEIPAVTHQETWRNTNGERAKNFHFSSCNQAI
jgi:hypothetical protein